MTTVHQQAASAAKGDLDEDRPSGGRRAVLEAMASEALLALEVGALAAFAFSRPVLDAFGRSPDTFVARGASDVTVVLFALIVALAPLLVLAGLGSLGRVFGTAGRWRVHLALVGVLGGLALWRLGQDITGWPGGAKKLILVGLVGGPLVAALRWKVPTTRTFLRYLGAASVLFLAQFLFMSPASSLISGERPDLDSDVTRAVSSALGDNAPPIVFVITDTFPTQALLDGHGEIDADLYPNIAALAGTSTWYRNSTTVSGFTNEAVPALLSGLYPEPSTKQQFVVPYPHNLFTLFGGTYDLHVREPVTRLCPHSLCDVEEAGLGPLLGDAVDTWTGATKPENGALNIPGLFQPDRYDDFETWIDAQDFRASERPDLFFYHAMLPHEPWSFLPDGTVYDGSDPPTGIWVHGWLDGGGPVVGHQRLVMQAQATDRLLGRLFDRMRAAGTFDDAMIVVAADHGQAFTAGEPWRAVSEAQYDQVMWAPLIMKAPHQSVGVTSDENVETIDVLPTMADQLGFDLPWDTDGIVAGGDDPRDPAVKYLDDVEANWLRSKDDAPRVEVDAATGLERLLAADPVAATGPDAVWKRTAHGELLGRSVESLDIASDTAGSVEVESLDRFDDIDVQDPLPLEVVGHVDQPNGTVVAYALNGTIAALTEVAPGDEWAEVLAHALLVPTAFADGANQLTAYVVDGPVASETLRPLQVDNAG